MKLLLNVLSVVFLGWPALIVGYVVAAIKSGYLTGAFLYYKAEEEAMDKFTWKAKAGRKE